MKTKKQIRQQGQKKAIVEAAEEIVQKAGWEAVTMRKIADKINYTPPVIYEHFENKEALLEEVQESWNRKMLALLEKNVVKGRDSEEALMTIALDYFHFAKENFSFYQVILERESLSVKEVLQSDVLQQVRYILKELLKPWISSNSHLENAVDAYRGVLHGMTSLSLHKKMPGDKDRAESLLLETVKILIQSWKKKEGSNDL